MCRLALSPCDGLAAGNALPGTERSRRGGWRSGDLSVLCAHHHHHQVYGRDTWRGGGSSYSEKENETALASRQVVVVVVLYAVVHLVACASRSRCPGEKEEKKKMYYTLYVEPSIKRGRMTRLEDISVTIADISHAACWTLLFSLPSRGDWTLPAPFETLYLFIFIFLSLSVIIYPFVRIILLCLLSTNYQVNSKRSHEYYRLRCFKVGGDIYIYT